jgi:phosphate transport system substrate-binding protein
MNTSARRGAVGPLVGLWLAAVACAPAIADTLTLQGSSTFSAFLLEPYQADIEAAAGHRLAVIPNKSNVGLLALFEGRAHLAMISTSLESEVAVLRKTKSELPFDRLLSFDVSRTRVAFAVHPNNSVRSTDPRSIGGVLMGQIDNWRSLGGDDLPIRVVLVREGGGVTLSIERALFRGERVSPRDPLVVPAGSEVAKVVKREPGALGLAQLGELKKHGVPELVTGINIGQELNLVTLGAPTTPIWAVINAARKVAIDKLH